MFAKERRGVIERFAEEENLSKTETIILITSVDSMFLDVKDLELVPGFIQMELRMKSGRGLCVSPNGDVFRLDVDRAIGPIVEF